ncbi:MAG TPA: Ig-like domain-containing protein [Pyrinomonadaceae bacterium]|nr:Ig-like domain-containing protein [Pyrinomonadaceae bacterium]
MANCIIRSVLALACLTLITVPGTFGKTNPNGPAQSVADTTAPTVWIVSPTEGSTVTGAKVRVTFYAFDLGGFDRYELYVDGVLKQTILPTAKNPYFTWNTGKGGGGDYTLVVRAYDQAGNVGTSPQITVFK